MSCLGPEWLKTKIHTDVAVTLRTTDVERVALLVPASDFAFFNRLTRLRRHLRSMDISARLSDSESVHRIAPI